jgi:N6-adenosine-specific RNA methylase IME4/ParB-like chromosome segregation protein Spo0J
VHQCGRTELYGVSVMKQFHPLADIFPLIEGAEFDDLVADIKAHGQREPIVLYEDKILDGRNRYRACEVAGIEPTFALYQGENPVAYVISLNLRRRHLDESQRAMVAAKLATLKQGARTDLSPIGEMSQVEAATLLNVGKRSVERATEVRTHGAAELVQAVERGDVSVTAAADVATLPVAEQTEIVARGEREILAAAKTIRGRRAEQRRTERIERLFLTTRQSAPLPSDRRFSVIYADPPWHFEVYNEESGTERAAGNHYPTLPLERICALPVPELAAEDALLFLWTTLPHLEEAFRVIAAWGFQYKTNLAWVKDKIGLGYFVRNQHELLVGATRGDIPSPAPAARPPSVIMAPRREHSRKPDEAYELIERMYPELPKIELFARSAREGWAAWGNQVPSQDDGLDIPEWLRREPKAAAS